MMSFGKNGAGLPCHLIEQKPEFERIQAGAGDGRQTNALVTFANQFCMKDLMEKGMIKFADETRNYEISVIAHYIFMKEHDKALKKIEECEQVIVKGNARMLRRERKYGRMRNSASTGRLINIQAQDRRLARIERDMRDRAPVFGSI